jgi:hypothetical protein
MTTSELEMKYITKLEIAKNNGKFVRAFAIPSDYFNFSNRILQTVFYIDSRGSYIDSGFVLTFDHTIGGMYR